MQGGISSRRAVLGLDSIVQSPSGAPQVGTGESHIGMRSRLAIPAFLALSALAAQASGASAQSAPSAFNPNYKPSDLLTVPPLTPQPSRAGYFVRVTQDAWNIVEKALFVEASTFDPTTKVAGFSDNEYVLGWYQSILGMLDVMTNRRIHPEYFPNEGFVSTVLSPGQFSGTSGRMRPHFRTGSMANTEPFTEQFFRDYFNQVYSTEDVNPVGRSLMTHQANLIRTAMDNYFSGKEIMFGGKTGVFFYKYPPHSADEQWNGKRWPAGFWTRLIGNDHPALPKRHEFYDSTFVPPDKW